MKKIKGLFTPTSSNNNQFIKWVDDDINLLQEEGQEVEIQYHPIISSTGQVFFSALIIGRVEE
nr:MAG TPA: hypothetical protein [Caudoviricetes sp.]